MKLTALVIDGWPDLKPINGSYHFAPRACWKGHRHFSNWKRQFWQLKIHFCQLTEFSETENRKISTSKFASFGANFDNCMTILSNLPTSECVRGSFLFGTGPVFGLLFGVLGQFRLCLPPSQCLNHLYVLKIVIEWKWKEKVLGAWNVCAGRSFFS